MGGDFFCVHNAVFDCSSSIVYIKTDGFSLKTSIFIKLQLRAFFIAADF